MPTYLWIIHIYSHINSVATLSLLSAFSSDINLKFLQKGRRERKRKQLLDNLKELRGYWKWKSQERTLWRTRFRIGHGPVEWQTMAVGERQKKLEHLIHARSLRISICFAIQRNKIPSNTTAFYDTYYGFIPRDERFNYSSVNPTCNYRKFREDFNDKRCTRTNFILNLRIRGNILQ
jgi:hypothetical protein